MRGTHSKIIYIIEHSMGGRSRATVPTRTGVTLANRFRRYDMGCWGAKLVAIYVKSPGVVMPNHFEA